MATTTGSTHSTAHTEAAHTEGTFTTVDQRLSLSREGLRIVKRRMWWSAGVGILPLPLIDFAALTGIQLTMLHDLCNLYGVPYDVDRGKQWIGSLIGSAAPSALKAIPGFGTVAGMLTGPAFFAASTYAIGRVFIQHFEAGGTLLTFDPAKMLTYFNLYLKEGKTQTDSVRTAAATR